MRSVPSAVKYSLIPCYRLSESLKQIVVGRPIQYRVRLGRTQRLVADFAAGSVLNDGFEIGAFITC